MSIKFQINIGLIKSTHKSVEFPICRLYKEEKGLTENAVHYKKLSTKWRNIKYLAKKKVSDFKAQQKRTGGLQPKFHHFLPCFLS
jgi:hypothetical protein